MKQRWLALVMALALGTTLTACGGNRKEDMTQPNNPVTNNGMENQVQGDTPIQDNGAVNDAADPDIGMNGENNTAVPDGVTPEVRGTGRTSDQNGQRPRTTMQRRSTYDFLRDGKYAADQNGRVRSTKTPGNDLTENARDMIRQGTEAVRRVGRDVTEATRDMLQ